MVHGIDPKWGPLAYAKSAEYPSHGAPDSSPDITGGMGFLGMRNLQHFIEQGGVLVTMANAGILAVDGGLVRGVKRASMAGLRTPGSELRAKVLRPEHPIAYGYPELTSVFRGYGPLFEVPDHLRGLAVLQFGTAEPEDAEDAGDEMPAMGENENAGEGGPGMRADNVEAKKDEKARRDAGRSPEAKSASPKVRAGSEELVLSGFVEGKGKINGKPAILDVPVGKGRVILFAFNPMHRYLNHSDFRFVYNVILNWNDMPPERCALTSAASLRR
jgi:hypothetical protein